MPIAIANLKPLPGCYTALQEIPNKLDRVCSWIMPRPSPAMLNDKRQVLSHLHHLSFWLLNQYTKISAYNLLIQNKITTLFQHWCKWNHDATLQTLGQMIMSI